ncbi:MAG: putative ABC transporter permease [Candidatus Saccharimonadales bacterium]
MVHQLSIYFLCFLLYSIIGWIAETIVCSIEEKKFVNRGFLNGPYCPIYGVGAISMVLILGSIQNIVVLFLISIILTSALEYFTSWIMEKLFNARWWDYSHRFLNINGRICIANSLIFGVLSVVVIKIIQPTLMSFFSIIPDPQLVTLAVIILVAFLVDSAFTIWNVAKLKTKLEAISTQLNKSIEQALTRNQRRVIKAFPKLTFPKYSSALQDIRNRIEQASKERKKQIKKSKKSKSKK